VHCKNLRENLKPKPVYLDIISRSKAQCHCHLAENPPTSMLGSRKDKEVLPNHKPVPKMSPVREIIWGLSSATLASNFLTKETTITCA